MSNNGNTDPSITTVTGQETSAMWPNLTGLNNQSSLHAAEFYARIGLLVLPVCTPIITSDSKLWCTHSFLHSEERGTIADPCESIGKRSLIKWNKEARESGRGPTTDLNKIRTWWERFTVEIEHQTYEPNIGALLGAPLNLWDGVGGRFNASLIAVDLDLKEINGQFLDGETIFSDFCAQLGMHGEQAPKTLTQRTGSGGKQLIYIDPSTPEAQVQQTVPWHQCVDLKATGGIIILPPSRHQEGENYVWLNELRPRMPGPLLSGAMKAAKSTRTVTPRGTSNTQLNGHSNPSANGSGDYLRRVREHGASMGERDQTFNDLAFASKKRGLTREQAETEIRSVWEKTENPKHDYYKLEDALSKIDYVYSNNSIQPEDDADGRLPGDTDPELEPFLKIAEEFISSGQSLGQSKVAANVQSSFIESTVSYLENGHYKIEDPPAQYGEMGIPDSHIPQDSPTQSQSISDQMEDLNKLNQHAEGMGNLPRAETLKVEGFTDWGSGNRLVRLYKDETDGGSPWAGTAGQVIRSYDDGINFVWDPKVDGTRWQVLDKDGIYPYMFAVCSDLAGQFERTNDPDKKKEIAKYLEYVKSKSVRLNLRYEFLNRPEVKINADDFDNNPYILNTPNGVVDLRTGELHAHHHKYMCTQRTSVPYYPEALQPGYAPLLDEFYQQFLPHAEDAEVIERALGYCLYGNNPERLFIFIKGSSSSGKGTLTEMALDIIGDYGSPAQIGVFRDSDTSKPRPDIIKAAKSRMISISELSHRNVMHADHIKRITGGATMSARNGHSNKVQELQPRFTPIVDTNVMPSIPQADEALKRRLFVASMDQSIPEHMLDAGQKKTQLKYDPRSREALLARLVQGAVRFHQRGLRSDKNLPNKYRYFIEEAYKSFSEITDFIDWAVEIGRVQINPQAPKINCITVKNFHRMYLLWAEESIQGEAKKGILGLRGFSNAISNFYPVEKHSSMRVVGIVEVAYAPNR